MTDARPDVAPDADTFVDARYLLALDSNVFRAADGSYWTDPLWARDLVGHMRHLRRMTMFGAVLTPPLPADAVRLPDDLGTRFVASRTRYGRKSFLIGLPAFLWSLLREVRRAEVVHTTISDSFIPYGWFAIPLARLLGRKSVVTVEASFWRLRPDEQPGLWRRIHAGLTERINRWMMRQVDYATYQHEQYRRTLPAPRAGGGVLTQASWIAAADVVGLDELEARWAARDRSGALPRAIFATRLIPDKGTHVVAAAVERLATMGIDLDLDLVGDGPDRALLAALDGVAIGRGRVRFHDPLPYGASFYGFLAERDLLLSPSLADEQPRIIYDAGAKGIGAIVSDTPGLRSCVVAGESALVVPRHDADALAEAVATVVRDPALLRRLGRAARANALAHTHERMHAERCRGINAMLARGRAASAQ